MKIKKIYLSAAILSLLATSAVAQETFELDDIIISGGIYPNQSRRPRNFQLGYNQW